MTVAETSGGAVTAQDTSAAKPITPPLLRQRLRAVVLAAIVPLCLLVFWDAMVRWTGTRLIPPPYAVAVMMWDFAFGGVYNDAYSASLPIHFWKSVQRVYGGFLCAALVGIPLGLLIGRVPLMRALLDPTLSLLRPVPVTAWLPLSMIFFGLGPASAIFLVFLGAFYPIVLNTTFGVRSVDYR